MNIAIIDDNKPESDLLIRFIDEYSETYSFEIKTSSFLSGEDFLSSLSPSIYSMAFMDIFMKGMDGIQTAEHLWEKDPQCLVVFLTVSQDHIWEAARLHCFDYIDKKTLTRARIFHVLSDIRKKLPQLNPIHLILQQLYPVRHGGRPGEPLPHPVRRHRPTDQRHRPFPAVQPGDLAEHGPYHPGGIRCICDERGPSFPHPQVRAGFHQTYLPPIPV